MLYTYQDKDYEVVINRKNNKNTYIRVKEDQIYVTTNYFTTTMSIKKLLKDNTISINKMIDKYLNKQKDKEEFRLFGYKYNILYDESLTDVKIDNNFIKAPSIDKLNIWLTKTVKEIFQKHLTYWYEQFKEPIPKPNLKCRKMTSRWGVCNTKNNNVTLNFELYRYDIECLDYVIIHELSHFIEPNHSKNFWKIVEFYCPEYKKIRNKLKK